MQEDAKAFADREEHEWNGITSDGMPAYLLGGDYVKTFNNDKIKNDIEITVKLDRAAKLLHFVRQSNSCSRLAQERFSTHWR